MMLNTSKDLFKYEVLTIPTRVSLESGQGAQTPRDANYNSSAVSGNSGAPAHLTTSVLPPIGAVPVCRKNGILVSTLLGPAPQTPPQTTHPLLQMLAISNVQELPLGGAAVDSTSFPGDCFSFSPSMDKVYWDPKRPPILQPMPTSTPVSALKCHTPLRIGSCRGGRRVSINTDDKCSSLGKPIIDSPSAASTVSEQSDREMSAASSPVSSRASSPSVEDNEAPGMRMCGAGVMTTDKVKIEALPSTADSAKTKKSKLRQQQQQHATCVKQETQDVQLTEDDRERKISSSRCAAEQPSTTATAEEANEGSDGAVATDAAAAAAGLPDDAASDHWLDGEEEREDREDEDGDEDGVGGASAAAAGEGVAVCEQCMQSLRDAPIINTRTSQRKKPISSVQKERTRRMFQSYLQKFKDSSANEKAAFVFANFTLCGGFKRLRQLVGYHNKQHATRAGATKITRHMDSKLQVLRECAADSTIPLWLFLNAKKPGSEAVRKPGKTGVNSGAAASGGPVRNTGKNRKRERDRPYP